MLTMSIALAHRGTSRHGFSLTDSLMKPWFNVGVKQFLILLLLLWMPLQASLAAFEEVHGHHDHSTAFVSHEHSDASTTHASDEPDAVEVDCAQDCSTSHLCNAQLLFLEHTRVIPPVASVATCFSNFSSFSPDRAAARPERPQWLTSSH